jgi:hypothetical protein
MQYKNIVQKQKDQQDPDKRTKAKHKKGTAKREDSNRWNFSNHIIL